MAGRYAGVDLGGANLRAAVVDDGLTPADIFAAAGNGDPTPLRTAEETGRFPGVPASDVAEPVNPGRYVISRGMIQAGAPLFDAVRSTRLDRNKRPGRTMEILSAQLGGNAGLIGAAGQARIRHEAKEQDCTHRRVFIQLIPCPRPAARDARHIYRLRPGIMKIGERGRPVSPSFPQVIPWPRTVEGITTPNRDAVYLYWHRQCGGNSDRVRAGRSGRMPVLPFPGCPATGQGMSPCV
ncbi:MAG: hypothetical protein LBJ46_00535 [Planctomycetota bacterium]|jgi:hypothetical protein|nr:hypothetical protein [Planctomycetota bacterium]